MTLSIKSICSGLWCSRVKKTKNSLGTTVLGSNLWAESFTVVPGLMVFLGSESDL